MNVKIRPYSNVLKTKFATTGRDPILAMVVTQSGDFVGTFAAKLDVNQLKGYVFDSSTNQCIDIDECSTSSHNCNLNANCINTNANVLKDLKFILQVFLELLFE